MQALTSFILFILIAAWQVSAQTMYTITSPTGSNLTFAAGQIVAINWVYALPAVLPDADRTGPIPPMDYANVTLELYQMRDGVKTHRSAIVSNLTADAGGYNYTLTTRYAGESHLFIRLRAQSITTGSFLDPIDSVEFQVKVAANATSTTTTPAIHASTVPQRASSGMNELPKRTLLSGSASTVATQSSVVSILIAIVIGLMI